MPKYVDGFVIPIPTKNVEAYRKVAQMASKVWLEHGALDYRECVGEDMAIKGVVSFLKLAKTKPAETVVFAWITYKSRAHRDKVNAKVTKDPRIAKMMEGKDHPFDYKKMAYSGFQTIVGD